MAGRTKSKIKTPLFARFCSFQCSHNPSPLLLRTDAAQYCGHPHLPGAARNVHRIVSIPPPISDNCPSAAIWDERISPSSPRMYIWARERETCERSRDEPSGLVVIWVCRHGFESLLVCVCGCVSFWSHNSGAECPHFRGDWYTQSPLSLLSHTRTCRPQLSLSGPVMVVVRWGIRWWWWWDSTWLQLTSSPTSLRRVVTWWRRSATHLLLRPDTAPTAAHTCRRLRVWKLDSY